MKVLGEFKGSIEVDKEFYSIFSESVSIDESRYFMHHVFYDKENSTFIATDGRRMITLQAEGYEEGFYDLAKIGKKFKLVPTSCDGQFPNWQRVMPEVGKYKRIQFEDPSEKFNFSGNLSKGDSRLLSKIVIETGSPINFDYIYRTLKVLVNPIDVLTHEDKDLAGKTPVLFQINPNCNYIVMPMAF